MWKFASTFAFHTQTYVYMYNINFIYKKSLPRLGKADTHKYSWCHNSSLGLSCVGPMWLFLTNKLSHNRAVFSYLATCIGHGITASKKSQLNQNGYKNLEFREDLIWTNCPFWTFPVDDIIIMLFFFSPKEFENPVEVLSMTSVPWAFTNTSWATWEGIAEEQACPDSPLDSSIKW